MQEAETGSDKEEFGTANADLLVAPTSKLDPDAYKDDWEDSVIYKKAMKAEAIKRGLPYEEFEVDEDEERVEMTATYNQSQLADALNVDNVDDEEDDSEKQQENAQEADNFNIAIGFMKNKQ